MAVGAAILLLAVDVAPIAFSAPTRLSSLHQTWAGALGSSDSTTAAATEVEQVGLDVEPATRAMRWVGRFSPALSWVPGLHLELNSWAVQAERVDQDLKSTAALLEAASKLLSLDERFGATLSTGLAGSPSSHQTDALRLQSSIADLIERMEDAVRRGDKYRPAIVPWRLADALSMLQSLESEILANAAIGLQASELLAELLAINARFRPLTAQFSSYTPEAEVLSVDDLSSMLISLDSDLRFASALAEGLAVSLETGGRGGALSDQVDTTRQLLHVLSLINRATLATIGPLQTSLDGSRALFGNDGLLLTALRQFAAGADEIDSALAQLDEAQETLRELQRLPSEPPTAREPLVELASAVAKLRGGIQLARDLAPIGDVLLASGSTQQYLVLGHSADELRATGGFVSAVWLVTIEDGELTDVQYHDAVRIDDWDRLELYPSAPRALEEHMNARVWLIRDVSWEPDYPTTARTAADMYRLGQRRSADGVIALNQWTLLSIVEALGNVPSPEGVGVLTTQNLFPKLEEGSDTHGRAYIDLAFNGVLEQLRGTLDLPTLIRLASALKSSLDNKDLMLYFDDAAVQAIGRDNGWSGHLRRESNDYIYVVDSNVVWSKSDRNIERRITYKVDLRKEAGPRISLNLGYNNHSGPGSPGCEPQWLHRGTDYSQLKNACYWNYWRAYIPDGATLRKSARLPLPQHSVAVEIGKGIPGEETVQVSSSFGKTVISGLFALGAGQSKELEFVYDLPARLLNKQGDAMGYELLIQKQPGIRQRDVTVSFILPDRYTLSSSSAEPMFNGESQVDFHVVADKDIVLTANFSKN